MAVDPAGNVYVALNVENKENQGITIIKCDPEGNEIWEVSDLGAISPGNVSWTWGAWLFVDDAYIVYFATTVWNGWAAEGGTDGDFLIAKFSQGFPSFRRGDASSDGSLNLTDAVFTLGYLFQAGTAPTGDCGPDPSEDVLGCKASPACP